MEGLKRRRKIKILKEGEDLRLASIHWTPEGEEILYLEEIRPAKGFGRWIYCKYCYKSVKPMLSGINQIVCSECGSGLTPDFFSEKSLRKWLESVRFEDGDAFSKLMEEDRNTEEGKKWIKRHKL